MARNKNKDQKLSKIKFQFPTIEGVKEVRLVGTFNNWNENANPLRRSRNGEWSIVLGLNPGKYEYKYKTNLGWFNDPKAQTYVGNPFGDTNSQIEVS